VKVSDFRSDTVTKPTDAMRRAMAEAEVGDDVLDGDPTVQRLEEAAARWLGKEGALFVPSGTMANQVAVGCWTRPGDEVIVEREAHLLLYEAGGLGYLHGVQTLTLAGVRGALDPREVARSIRSDYVHVPRTGLVCMEQTHMSAGGRVVPLELLDGVADVCRERGVPVHLDGARLPNAVAASGVPAAEFAARADSVTVCLSKGLGAPVGSIVAGDAAFRERAVVVRKRLGGWMRQAGCIAAAGLLALEEGVEHLADDHHLAREVAATVAGFDGLVADPEQVETNLVVVEVDPARIEARALADGLAARGVLVLALGPSSVRFVTHRDVGLPDVERLRGALTDLLG